MFCNNGHPAVAFVGAMCPACVFKAAPGAVLGTSSVEALKNDLRVILKVGTCEQCGSAGFEKSKTGAGCESCDGSCFNGTENH